MFWFVREIEKERMNIYMHCNGCGDNNFKYEQHVFISINYIYRARVCFLSLTHAAKYTTICRFYKKYKFYESLAS